MAVKRYHIFSTMTSDVSYNGYAPAGDGSMSVLERSVVIKGKAGIPDKNLVTPLGMHTEVSQEDMEFLNANGIFKLHKDNGFITVQSRDMPVEKAAEDMNLADPSAPLTPADFDNGDGKTIPKLMGNK